jgi:hypothetical protein
MQYLLDANVLIDAARDYYPFDMVPEFWDWLLHHASIGDVKVPIEVYEEISDGKDDVALWLRRSDVKTVLLLDEAVDSALVATTVSDGYASDLTDDEIGQVGRDPFLIAYARAEPGQRCVVTTESSRPSRIRQNRHIPDVCRTFGVPTCNTFDFTRRLSFRTSWKSPT